MRFCLRKAGFLFRRHAGLAPATGSAISIARKNSLAIKDLITLDPGSGPGGRQGMRSRLVNMRCPVFVGSLTYR